MMRFCEYCGNSFNGKPSRRFCSHDCYCDSLVKPYDYNLAEKLYLQGKSLKQVAREFNVSIACIRKNLIIAGIKMRSRGGK